MSIVDFLEHLSTARFPRVCSAHNFLCGEGSAHKNGVRLRKPKPRSIFGRQASLQDASPAFCAAAGWSTYQ